MKKTGLLGMCPAITAILSSSAFFKDSNMSIDSKFENAHGGFRTDKNVLIALSAVISLME